MQRLVALGRMWAYDGHVTRIIIHPNEYQNNFFNFKSFYPDILLFFLKIFLKALSAILNGYRAVHAFSVGISG